MRAGRLYVLRNENMRELLVKVGKTLRSADERAAELGGATGVVGRFHVLFQEPVVDVDHAEVLVRVGVNRREDAYRLQKVLGPHRGGDIEVAILFEHRNSVALLALDDSWRVRFCEQLIEDVETEFGRENVLFVRWPVDTPAVPSDPSADS